jgi:MFS family permease
MIAIGFPLVSINLGPMVLELGKDSDAGRYMGYYYIAATVSQIVTPTIASFFINSMGYKVIGFYAGIFCLVACVCGFFVRHGDAKPIMVKAVDEAVADS